MGHVQFDFKGTTVAITGAAGGIGKGIAMEFARAGANVAIADMKEDAGSATVAEMEALGAKALFVKTDVTNQESVDQFIQATVSAFGSLDVLVNGAGVGNKNFGFPFTDFTDADFDFTYKVNLLGMIHTCRAVYDMFRSRRSGKIINICSVVAHSTNPMNVPYNVSKAGAVSLTMNLAKELGPYNINVNGVNPGFVYTPMYEMQAPGILKKLTNVKSTNGKELVDELSFTTCALQRPQTPADMGYAALFLASEQADNITGVMLDVAGGYKL